MFVYKDESGFSHLHYLLRKQWSTWNIECTDLELNLTNLQLTIYDFLIAHQIHPSH